MWVDPHIDLPALGLLWSYRSGFAILAILMPSVVAVNNKSLPSVFLNRRASHPPETMLPACRILPGFPVELLDHGSCAPVHRARVVS